MEAADINELRLQRFNLEVELCSKTDWEVFLCDVRVLEQQNDLKASLVYHHPQSLTNDYKLMKYGQLVSKVTFNENLYNEPTSTKMDLADCTCRAHREGSYALFVIAKSRQPNRILVQK